METDRLLAILVHPIGYFTSFIGPLVLMLVLKDQPETNYHSKQALNFQLTLLIAIFVSAILIIVLIGVFMLIACYVLMLVFVIIGAIKAANGEEYRIPVAIQFFK